MDLVTFLRARLTEDEQTALAASGPKAKFRIWDVDPWYGGEVKSALLRARVLGPITSHPIDAVQAEHAARHDPARVLAEVDAKRKLIDLCEVEEESEPATSGDLDLGYEQGYRDGSARYAQILMVLALPYAGHPDYRDEWRP